MAFFHKFYIIFLFLIFCYGKNQAQLIAQMKVTIMPNDQEALYVYCQVPNLPKGSTLLSFKPVLAINEGRTHYQPIDTVWLHYNNQKSLPTTVNRNGEFALLNNTKIIGISFIYKESKRTNKAYVPACTQLVPRQSAMLHLSDFTPRIEGMDQLHFDYTFDAPKTWLGLSSLYVSNFNHALSSLDLNTLNQVSVIYSQPDTISYVYHNIRFHILSVSYNKADYSTKKITNIILPCIRAAFDEIDTFRHKDYLLYFNISPQNPNYTDINYGGLNTENVAMFYLPELKSKKQTRSMIEHTVTHELLHTLCPEQLKSELTDQIPNADNNYSKHIWLYEGVTEYITLKVLLKNGLLSEEEFMDNIRQKIFNYYQLPPVSLVKMSENIHKEIYRKIYTSIYSKGALVAMLMDINLIDQSSGRYDLLKLINQLTDKYGYENRFDDATFFSVVIKTGGNFLQPIIEQYLEGKSEIDFVKMFDKLGWKYNQSINVNTLTFGEMSLDIQSSNKSIGIIEAENNILGLKTGDLIQAINDTLVSDMNVKAAAAKLVYPDPNQTLRLLVNRNGIGLMLSGRPKKQQYVSKYVLQNEPRNEFQKRLKEKLFFGINY